MILCRGRYSVGSISVVKSPSSRESPTGWIHTNEFIFKNGSLILVFYETTHNTIDVSTDYVT